MRETRERILAAMADGPASAAVLAADAGVSRDAVRDHVDALREAGFDVDDADDGYELVSVPDYGTEALEFGLDAPFDVEYHDEIGSTNDRGRELAAESTSDVVVVADRQSVGRGRRDREWSSPSGGIWLSIVCRPAVPAALTPLFTLAGAVAAARAAKEVGVDTGIKWPNDVLVDGRKLAGVLTESAAAGDGVDWLVVGVGVNANVDPEALPGDRDPTSLSAELGESVDRRAVVQRLLETFDDLRADPGGILPAWRDLTVTLGRDVRVETPERTVVGRAVDVTDAGALVVETDDGRATVAAGDCEHLRAADG